MSWRRGDITSAFCSRTGEPAARPISADRSRSVPARSNRAAVRQAALTELRNWATSCFRRPLSPDSDCAADRICDDAEPVSEAPRCTSTTLLETCCVPCAACCTLREISCVAAPCSSTAAAIVEDISEKPLDRNADLLDRIGRVLGRRLDAGYLLADFAGRLRGLFGERLHLRCDHGETPTRLAGASGLDGRVQGKQVGLSCDRWINSTTSPMRAAAADSSPTRPVVRRA